jgi:AcrR family transcriptional regulator
MYYYCVRNERRCGPGSDGVAHGPTRRAGTLAQRDRILAVAARVLAERGFERARFRDVAEAAGVSIGLLQNYFTTRDEMFEEAFSSVCAQLISRWRGHATRAGDPWAKIVGLVDELTGEPDLRGHATTWLEFCASASRHSRLRPPVLRVYSSWRRILLGAVNEGIALGVFCPAGPAEDVVDTIDAVVDGLHVATAVRLSNMSPRRFRELVLHAARLLLATSGAAEDAA